MIGIVSMFCLMAFLLNFGTFGANQWASEAENKFRFRVFLILTSQFFNCCGSYGYEFYSGS